MGTTSPRVTIALPYYDAPIPYVEEAIRSLLAQSVTTWTAFVLDDSPNGAPEVEAVVNRISDDRIFVARNDGPHGIGNAWNACFDRVRTPFACLLHTDDAMEPAYLQTMVDLADEQDAAIYFCGATVVDENGKPTFSLADRVKDFIVPKDDPIVFHGEPAVMQLTIGDFIMCPTMFYRMSGIGLRRFSSDHQFVLDFRMVLDLLFDGHSIVGTHRKAFRYRRHAQQATAGLTKTGPRFDEELELYQEIIDRSRKRQWKRAEAYARMRPTFRANAILSRRWSYAVTGARKSP